MGTASQTLADFVAGLRYEDIPRDVVAAAKRHLLDAVGVSIAAASAGEAAPVVEMVRSWSAAREASVLGYDFGAPAPLAALINGTLAHALCFDDTHPESVTHPSAVVMPAAFAVAEEAGADGQTLITAAVAGYEVLARLGAAAPGRFQARSFDTTGVCGSFGAAAAAGRLWRLSAEELAHAFGIAGSRAAGLTADATEGTTSGDLQAGWAAHAGVLAADLTRRGSTGPASLFEGPHGFFDALLAGEEPDHGRLTRGLGEDWETTRIACKPYPASDFVHAAMDAAARAGVRWADIEAIVCRIPPAVVGLIAEPRAARLHPASARAARWSLPFAVATVVVGGRSDLALFGEEALGDRRVLTLAERVHHEPDPRTDFPRAYGASVTVHTRGGRTIEIDEPVNRGHPDRPLSDKELADKFVACVKPRFGGKVARKLLTRLQCLDEVRDVEALMTQFRVG